MALTFQDGRLILVGGPVGAGGGDDGLIVPTSLGIGSGCCCGEPPPPPPPSLDCDDCGDCQGTVDVGGQSVVIGGPYTVICVNPDISPLTPFWQIGSSLGWSRAYFECKENEATGQDAIHVRVEVGLISIRYSSDAAAYSLVTEGQTADTYGELLNLVPSNFTFDPWAHLLRFEQTCADGEFAWYDSQPFPVNSADFPMSDVPPCYEQAVMDLMTTITASVTCGENPLP